MSGKNGRAAKVLRDEKKIKNGPCGDSPNVSALEKASFLEGLQRNDGNVLHSTAVEEDLNAEEEPQMNRGENGRKAKQRTLKTAVKQSGAGVKRKEAAKNGENVKEEQEKKKQKISRKSTGEKARPVKNKQKNNNKKTERESGSGQSSDAQSQEEHRRKNVLSSDEEVLDDDKSWNPSPKRAKMTILGQNRKSKSRKSSSGSASAEAEKVEADKERRKRRGRQAGTELEVVLDSFLDFCEQYSESVASKEVKQSIDRFSSNVKEQLLEKISSNKELRVLKRENAKVGSLIRTKTQRMLDAKYELMRAERQASLLQKEKAELELRVADLRQGRAFLHDIRELNTQYLDIRRKHPADKETFGAASLPALLLEAKHVQSTEHQLSGINNQLEEMLKKKKKNGPPSQSHAD